MPRALLSLNQLARRPIRRSHTSPIRPMRSISRRASSRKNSKNPKVVAFAEDMIRDHTAVNEQALALLKKLKVEPEGNETSRTLAGQGEAQLQKLSSLQATVRLAMEIRLEITPLCKRRLPCGTRRTATLPRSRVRRSINRLATPGALLSRAGG